MENESEIFLDVADVRPLLCDLLLHESDSFTDSATLAVVLAIGLAILAATLVVVAAAALAVVLAILAASPYRIGVGKAA